MMMIAIDMIMIAFRAINKLMIYKMVRRNLSEIKKKLWQYFNISSLLGKITRPIKNYINIALQYSERYLCLNLH